MGITRTRLVLALLALVLMNGIVWHALHAPNGVRVAQVAEGQGAATLVTIGATRVLVGAGADASVLRGLGTTLLPWQRSLTVLVLPNLKPDTAGGAVAVLARYRVGALLRTAFPGTNATERTLVDAESASGLRSLALPPGAELDLGGGAFISFASAPNGLSATLIYGPARVPLASTTPAGTYLENGTRLPG